jgi:hypothetical protein
MARDHRFAGLQGGMANAVQSAAGELQMRLTPRAGCGHAHSLATTITATREAAMAAFAKSWRWE